MQRFIQHWRRYTSVSKDALRYLHQHAKVLHFMVGDHFMQANERRYYWCIMLEGLAVGYTLYKDGHRRIRWFAPPMVDFTGTRHLHTTRKTNTAIQFILPTALLCIPTARWRAAEHRYREVTDLMHILKQRRIDQQRALIEVLQEPYADLRFEDFMANFTLFAQQTSAGDHMDFISLGNGSYYRAKNRYIRKH